MMSKLSAQFNHCYSGRLALYVGYIVKGQIWKYRAKKPGGKNIFVHLALALFTQAVTLESLLLKDGAFYIDATEGVVTE